MRSKQLVLKPKNQIQKIAAKNNKIKLASKNSKISYAEHFVVQGARKLNPEFKFLQQRRSLHF